jgi:hypothetical protein
MDRPNADPPYVPSQNLTALFFGLLRFTYLPCFVLQPARSTRGLRP